MTAASKVTLKIDIDNTDALRKIRQVGREARRTQRATSSSLWALILDIALILFGLGYGLTGLFRHSAFLVAAGCLFLIVADR